MQSHCKVSFKRLFKHFFYLSKSKYYFSTQDLKEISNTVTRAEQGHVGEIQVVIEDHIPCNLAYYQNTAIRARHIFSELGVWDTEYNSGVLLYINLCERRVEIVFDRGIKKTTPPYIWQDICKNVTIQMKNKKYQMAIVQAVEKIGAVLNEHYAHIENIEKFHDELSDDPIIL